MKVFFSLFLILLSNLTCFAQAQDSLMNKFNVLNNKLYKEKPVNYLKGLKFLDEDKSVFQGTNLESFYFQVSANFYTRIGKYSKAKQQFIKSKQTLDSIDVGQYRLRNPKKSIIKASKITQILMINENHVYPEHRVFTASLLEDLYKTGYRYLALEDLTDKTNINSRKYPIYSDGFYANEIMYGNMLRKALEIGFKLIPYDNNNAWDIVERDSIGALEIKKIFDKDPKAKVLIHCGFGHIDKSSKTLSFYLENSFGFAPVTVNQVNYIKPTNKCDEPKILLFKNGNKDKLNFPFKADFQVIHSNCNNNNKREKFLFKNGREKLKLNIEYLRLDKTKKYIAEVRIKDEPNESIPLDRFLFDSSENTLELTSFSKEITVLILDENYQILKRINPNN